jgi:hypothetical protein
VPIIRELLSHGHEITIGTSGNALTFLKKEFPECTFIVFEDYPIPLNNGRIFLSKYTACIPGLIESYITERKKAEKIFCENSFDLVISDSRSGVFSRHIPSILITHQLHQSLPLIAWPIELLGVYVHADAFSKFTKIIVPDNAPGNGALAGKLSRTYVPALFERIYYCGILASVQKEAVKKDIDYLIIISGMEPQRTVLERILLSQIPHLPGRKVVLLGKPMTDQVTELDDGTLIYSYISNREKSSLMSRAHFIISRSGYTTMMDIAEAGVGSGLLIPTPGQWEQEYLSRYYSDKGWFLSQSQHNLRLPEDVRRISGFSGFPSMTTTDENVRQLYRNVVSEYL